MSRPADPPRLQLRVEPGRPPVWLIVWREDGRKRRRSTGVGDRRTADRLLQAFRREIRPDLTGRPLDEIPIADLLDRYAADAAARTVDPARIGYAVKRLLPFWAGLTVADVDAAACRRYAGQRAAGAGTVRRELATLRAALRQAAAEKLIAAAPPVWLPQRPPPRPDWLSRAQVARLIRAARAEPKARAHLPWFILLGFYAGARKRALLDLRWRPGPEGGAVDLRRRRIDFNPKGRPPTKKRRPVQPIPPALYVCLRALAKRAAETVISDRDGRPVADVKRSFATAARAAGVPWATPHTLRHSCITNMLLNGASRYDVSAWAAISLDELERTYGHHAPDYLAAAAATWRRPGRAMGAEMGAETPVKPRQ